jgi:Tol biopolymer transport system component
VAVRLALAGAALLGFTPIPAQAPGTDIYVAPLTTVSGKLVLGIPVNVTHRPGYDNQPSFLPDGSSLLYTSIRDNGQADTWRYDLATGTSTRLTATPESEYSPTPLPLDPGFSAVRVEADSAQRLWGFDPGGSSARLLLPDVKPVGYHAWSDRGDVALFVLGRPPTLQLVPAGATSPIEVARDIGRGLARVPGERRILFAQRDGDGYVITSLSLDDHRVTPVVRTPLADFFAYAGGVLFAADSTRILAYRPASDSTWVPLSDFAAHGIRRITRIAVSPRGDRLAFVAEDGQ